MNRRGFIGAIGAMFVGSFFAPKTNAETITDGEFTAEEITESTQSRYGIKDNFRCRGLWIGKGEHKFRKGEIIEVYGQATSSEAALRSIKNLCTSW